MKLKFTNHRQPSATSALSATERAQLEAAGKAYDGHPLSAEERLGEVDDGRSFKGALSIWDLVDEDADGRHTHTFFHYMVDSGCFFRAGTTEVDAEIIQFYLDNPASPALARAIAEAAERQGEELRAGHSAFDADPEDWEEDA